MSDDERVPVIVPWILVAGVGLALLATTLMRGGPEAGEFPADIDGRAVITVTRAIEVQFADVSSDVLVQGWFVTTPVPPCMAPDPAAPPLTPLEDPCRPRSTITEDEFGGPSLDVFLDGVDTSWAGEFGSEGETRPIRVVLVGHFGDPRAEDCAPENKVACGDQLVVTEVPWVDGRELR